MSEIKRISPILDDFDIGSSMSEHHGVTCYPAMRINSDDKYIIKTVSIPASQTKLDALLLTGAFADETQALSYFKDLADQTVEELELLKKLSGLEGFLPYESWQVSAMSDRIGFDVYMYSNYMKTLRKYMQRQPMTQLGAINLGLDMCTALAACRHLGYLYIDLKPNNIYITGDNKFKIGDIGFLPIASLSYATLPDRCRSEYTAPEVQDPFAMLNSTIDIYALGLILYQTYNGGDLPSNADIMDGMFPPPAYADYEIAEIILKACAADPEARWQDPVQMGQALVSYMQRNGANDVPITVPVIPVEDTAPYEEAEIDLSGVQLAEGPAFDDSIIEDEVLPEVSEDHELQIAEELVAQEALITEESPEAIVEETEPVAELAAESIEEAEVATDDGTDETELLDISLEDETTPENNITDVDYQDVSDELSQILTQVDELAALQVPDPVVAPEPIEIQLPEPVEPVADATAESEDTESPAADPVPAEENLSETVVIPVKSEESEEITAEDPAENESDAEAPTDQKPPVKKRSVATWILNAVLILLILAIIAVGFFYYKNIYLLPINNVTVTGDESSMAVHLESNIDESLLSVVCSDSHGNQISAPVVDGMATFANLAPDTVYNIQILVEGFHRLTGETAASYSTPPQTNVVQFLAVTGTENGSAILQFTDDPTSDCPWYLTYSAEGEEDQTVEMLSHFTTLSGLTVGKEYTFTLTPAEDMYVTGQTEITFTASDLVFAEDVAIVSCVNNQLVVDWNAPEGSNVAEWTVRCYNDDIGYNETMITADTTATFQVTDSNKSYFVDVTAAGMSVSQVAYMPENAITITSFTAKASGDNKLTLNWETDQGVPEGGWILMYTVDDSGIQSSVTCDENSAVISPIVPNATYTFTLQQTNGDGVLTYPLSYTTAKPQDFSGYGMIRSSMTYKLCKRPAEENWKYSDLSDSDYVNTFKVGEEISVVGQLHDTYGISDDKIVIMYVFRDADGKAVSYCYSESTWNDMWSKSYGEFDVPSAPSAAGEYTLNIYFNGKLAANKKVTIE